MGSEIRYRVAASLRYIYTTSFSRGRRTVRVGCKRFIFLMYFAFITFDMLLQRWAAKYPKTNPIRCELYARCATQLLLHRSYRRGEGYNLRRRPIGISCRMRTQLSNAPNGFTHLSPAKTPSICRRVNYIHLFQELVAIDESRRPWIFNGALFGERRGTRIASDIGSLCVRRFLARGDLCQLNKFIN